MRVRTRVPLDIDAMARGGRVSTGLLAWHRRSMVFVASRPEYWTRTGGHTSIDIIGVGGGREAGETLVEAVTREALEEASSRIRLVGAGATLVSWEDGRLESVLSAGDDPLPILVWQRVITMKRAHAVSSVPYACAVYEALLIDEPRPPEGETGLFWVGEELFRSLLSRPLPLADFIGNGGRYRGASLLPPDAVLGLSGSARYLAQYWDLLERGDRESTQS